MTQKQTKEENLNPSENLKIQPDDNRSLTASQLHSAVNYAETLRRVEQKIAAEVNFNPDSHTFLLTHGTKTEKIIVFVHGCPSNPYPFEMIATQFFDQGYNVLAMAMPYHGLADRMNTENEKLRAEDFVRYADNVMDISRGLGDHVTMAGISCGGLITGRAAQQRQDLDLAVLISPGFGIKAISRFWTPLMACALRILPNFHSWDDPGKKGNNPRSNDYHRLSSHVVGEILRMSRTILASARQKAPAADSILVVTNLNDPAVDNPATDRVVDLWRTRWGKQVRTFKFPARLGLGRDVIDMKDPNMKVEAVYPKLFELIDQPAHHTLITDEEYLYGNNR